jgi:hypothetical protein
MPLVNTIIHSQPESGVISLNINIELREFGSFVFRETLAPPVQEAIPSTEQSMPFQITLPLGSTQDGERVLFGPAMLTFG